LIDLLAVATIAFAISFVVSLAISAFLKAGRGEE
jgi:hypothetical protein